MSTLFDINFENGKFISDMSIFGNYVFCSGGTIEIIANPGSMLGNYCMSVTPKTTTLSNYAGHAYLSRYIEPQTRLRQRFYFDYNSISTSLYKSIDIEL